jgi:hypothetical protein
MHSQLLKTALAWCLGCLLAGVSQLALAQARTETVLELPIANGVLPAELHLIKVQKGEHLRWRISSNTAGELHLHAYRLSAQLQAGQTTELAFVAHASGRFRLEWHGANNKSAAAGSHHAPPLAILEVRPH